MPFFTNLKWYSKIDGKSFKRLPEDIESLLTPIALAFWIMGDGGWDKSRNRINLYTNWFTLSEVKKITK